MSSVGTLHLAVIEAKDIVAANANGSSDTYCLITCGKTKLRTPTLKHTREPEWNQSYAISVEHPEDVVVLEVYNENWVRKDEFLGQTQLAVSDFAGGVEEDRWLKLWEKPAPIDGRRASLGIETSVFSSNGTASTETLDAQTTPANPVVPAVATITLEPVPSSVTTSDSAAKVADPSGTNTLTVTPMVPTDKLTPRGSPTAVANTASPAAKTAALTSDPQYRAASRPYDHTVFRGFIHVKIMFNSVDPLLFRSAANANANLSSSNQTGRDSPSSRSRSQNSRNSQTAAASTASLDTNDAGDTVLVGSPGVNKVDVMLSRRQQLKKHVHSKLAKLRGIRVIDDSGSSTTTSPAVPAKQPDGSSVFGVKVPTDPIPDHDAEVAEAVKRQMQAEEELGFLPKNRQRFLNFTLVPSKPEPTAPADADTAPVKVAFADPDAYKKLAIAANAAASARVEAATATTATVALTGIQSRELPMSAFAAEQSAYSDGFVLSDQAVTDGTDSIKPVPSPASPAAPVSAPAPLAPTASTVSLHTHLDSAALLGADITDPELINRVQSLYSHLKQKSQKLQILKQAYSAKDTECKRLRDRVTELEAELAEQKELNRSLVRAITTPPSHTSSSADQEQPAVAAPDSISIAEHKRVVSQLESQLRLLQQDRAQMMEEARTFRALYDQSKSKAESKAAAASRAGASDQQNRSVLSPPFHSVTDTSSPARKDTSAGAEVAQLQTRFKLEPSNFLIDSFDCSGGRLHVFSEHLCFEPSSFSLSLTPQKDLVLRLWSIIEIKKTKPFLPLAPVGFSCATSDGKSFEFTSVSRRDDCVNVLVQQSARLQHKIVVRAA